MKTKLFLIGCICAIVFSGCNSKAKEYQAAQVEIESLKAELQQRDNEMSAVFDAINDIEENLSAVTSKYQNIEKLKKGNVEGSRDAKVEIQNQIADINQLLEENRNNIRSLTSKLNSSDSKLKDATTLITRLETRVKEQDEQINGLLTELEQRKIIIGNLSKDVENLQRTNVDKDQIISQKNQEANVAYYIIGLEKDLLKNDVIDKQGRSRVLSADANPEYFTKIDIRNVRSIPINAKKAELITRHPESSYEFITIDKNIESIQIKNVDEFWKLSRYLIIKIKN